MTYSEQLERETESCREQLADTLDELRMRMTPGEVVDQLVDYAQDTTGGLFFENLKKEVTRNPLPVALMGLAHVRQSHEWIAPAAERGLAAWTRTRVALRKLRCGGRCPARCSAPARRDRKPYPRSGRCGAQRRAGAHAGGNGSGKRGCIRDRVAGEWSNERRRYSNQSSRW